MWMVSVGIDVGASLLSFVYAGWVLFYGYRFGLYDQVPPTLMFALVLVIFAGQTVFSRLWLTKYRLWLWRSLTYGWWQELRRQHQK